MSRKKFIAVLAALFLLATASPAVAQWEPARFEFQPREVAPGGRVGAMGYGVLGCLGRELVSPGFIAPMKFEPDGGGHYYGTTTVIMTPGTYPLTFYCVDGSAHDVGPFKILDVPPATTTPPPSKPPLTKPPAKPKPQPPVVRPRGGVDTGGGGTS